MGAVWNPQRRTYIPFNQNEYQRLATWQRNLANFPDWQMGYQAWFRNNGLDILSNNRVPMNDAALRPELERVNGAYALMIIDSPNVADSHAMAAYIGGRNEDACFFDPNYGEFWFENRDDFFFFLHLMTNFCYHRNHQHNIGFDRCKIVRIYSRA